ncbi:hypothetical protein IEQ34_013242 [Dendrobium chrysotoxum]|uniref:Uncharacterized protein n=1 Tax=Dendrobium chrysotoxum TaxID=161865 RepID=A0AAV7GPD9_DENCH|nr:hypothetical protein IEQ34_013242 [Dendrobium chrysotoxum]
MLVIELVVNGDTCIDIVNVVDNENIEVKNSLNPILSATTPVVSGGGNNPMADNTLFNLLSCNTRNQLAKASQLEALVSQPEHDAMDDLTTDVDIRPVGNVSPPVSVNVTLADHDGLVISDKAQFVGLPSTPSSNIDVTALRGGDCLVDIHVGHADWICSQSGEDWGSEGTYGDLSNYPNDDCNFNVVQLQQNSEIEESSGDIVEEIEKCKESAGAKSKILEAEKDRYQKAAMAVLQMLGGTDIP